MDLNVITQLLYWLIISTAIGVPLILSGYVLITPTHALGAIWQNYKMRREPNRALKDRHFKGLPRKVRICKFICFFLFLIFLWLALLEFHIDPLKLLQHSDQ